MRKIASWSALVALSAVTVLALAWGPRAAGAQPAGDESAAALATAVQALGGVPADQCPAENPQATPCVSLADDPESLARGVARFDVSYGPSQPGSYVAVFGRMVDGAWGYWFGAQDQQPELAALPGDLLACAGSRGASAHLLTPDISVALAPLTPLRAERFVLTAPGYPGNAQTRSVRGSGWYQVSAPVLGLVSSLESTNAIFGNCGARVSTLPPNSRTIVVESPLPGATVSSAFEVRGWVSTAPFENTLNYAVYDAQEQLVSSGPITVEAGLGQPGPFAGTITFVRQPPGPGRLVIVEPNAAGGAPFVAVNVPIVMAPTSPPPSLPTVTGVVTYRERIALPPNAVLMVRLQDVSRTDAPAVVLGEQTILTQGAQVPIPFEIRYDPAGIDPRFSYSVAARIEVDNQLWFINTRAYFVLTRGYPDHVEMVLEFVRR